VPSKREGTLEILVPVFFEKDGDGFHAYSPILKGLHTCGDTEDEVRQNAANAVIAYVKSLIKHRDPLLIELIMPPNAKFKVKKPSVYKPRTASTRKEALAPELTVEPELILVGA
jgi:predicted RNase H-like HicB family nuclease